MAASACKTMRAHIILLVHVVLTRSAAKGCWNASRWDSLDLVLDFPLDLGLEVAKAFISWRLQAF